MSMLKIQPYLVQSFVICPREAWMEAHGIHGDQDQENLSIGRLVHETSYRRSRKEIFVDQLLKIDLFQKELVAEVKRSSRHKKSARLQLAYYLYYLKHEKGLELKGILLFPKERRTEKLELTPKLERQIEDLLQEMKRVLKAAAPPPPVRIPYCRSCSFLEICWG